MFSNIWQHPRTSVTGVLLAVVTVAGVLSQQGITLGTAGTGTVVTLIAALGTALLGLLSQDPGNKTAAKPPVDGANGVKLGCWGLIILLLVGMTGCTASQVNQAVSEINTFLPSTLSLLSEVVTIYSAVGASNTADSQVVTVLDTVQADLTALQQPLSDYLGATSSSAKTTAWTNIQALVDTATTNSDTLLQVAKVKDANSKQAGTIIIASLDAAVHVLDAYVSNAQSKSTVQAKLAKRSIKLRTVAVLWSSSDRQMIAKAAGVPYPVALRYAEAQGF